MIFSTGAWAKNPAAETKLTGNTLTGSSEQAGSGTLQQIAISVGDGQDTPVFAAGEKTTLTINVSNKGNTDAQNVRITPVVTSTDKWPFDMDKLNYELELGTIEAGKQAAAVWGSEKEPLTVSSDVTGKSYQLMFQITYDDGQKIYETEKYVFVKTQAEEKPDDGDSTDKPQDPQTPQDPQSPQEPSNPGSTGGSAGGDVLEPGGVYNEDPVISGGGGGDTESASVPRVIVTGFSTEPAEVKAGDNFKLIVHLKNTSKRTGVSNMLFDFQAPAAGTDAAAEAPAFLPVSGSSSVYLENIAANGTKDISIDLNARADLVQKPYSITMSMLYEDKNAVQYDGQSSLAIPVKQEARYEFSEIQVNPESVSVGEEANITCNLYNLGQVKMYNVKVRFESEAIQGQEQFVGNLDSGATGTVDAIVSAVAESYDDSNCKLVLSYEDDAGNVTTVEQPFTVMVSPMEEITDVGMYEEFPEETQSSPLPGILVALAAVIVLVVIAVVVVVKRRKKKRMAEEEEELMDEVERFTEDERE
ncbi:MAG TPA: hypothetical protein H9955_12105 [Candidatus Mediterraneibacter cottocaccae]|nr:hypothetical protein [Candidatus Mediterraneibacter cottocaccae]